MTKDIFEKKALFKCQGCGQNFYTLAAAEKAHDNGCPKCNGKEIDIIRVWDK